jgi:hypothetical protein
VDDGERGAERRETAGMTIELPAAEVYALADALRSRAQDAEEAGSRLGGASVGGSVQPALEAFLDAARTAAQAMAGELRWLGSTVSAVADSWLTLDGSLLTRPGRPGAE